MQIMWSAVAASLLPNAGGIVGGLITRKNIPIWYKVSCFHRRLALLEYKQTIVNKEFYRPPSY